MCIRDSISFESHASERVCSYIERINQYLEEHMKECE